MPHGAFLMELHRSVSHVGNAVCWFLILLACTCPSNQRELKTNIRQLEPTHEMRKRLPDDELPICSGNLLDQRDYHYEKENLGYFDTRRLMSKTGSCQLLQYTVERAVACLDAIKEDNPQQKFLHLRRRMESEILLDHDRKSQPSPIPLIYHEDIEVISDILRLKLSFQWRPLLDGNVTEAIRQWVSLNNDEEQPYFIFLSMVLWHIVRIHSQEEYNVYQESLKNISPVLNQLMNNSRVIWLNQYPMLTFYEGMQYGGVNNLDIILSENAHRYNEAIRSILENRSGVHIWDSSNPLAEEYVRSCVFIRRGHSKFALSEDPDHTFINCEDYIHTGYSALSLATQLLFNDLCNTHLEIDFGD
ncbi:uncharacterized protein LOC130688723 isoform X2 [Daphnia carinata]|uniref:uncharacterized protein LOC130688723 isoform X2 n=1 Tax=Daphnia carinata TaxID=120202 RepID=UPI002579C861|nr:uncharacterized protein LOC130688723 isoform X2 [Daphnia carinata]